MPGHMSVRGAGHDCQGLVSGEPPDPPKTPPPSPGPRRYEQARQRTFMRQKKEQALLVQQ